MGSGESISKMASTMNMWAVLKMIRRKEKASLDGENQATHMKGSLRMILEKDGESSNGLIDQDT